MMGKEGRLIQGGERRKEGPPSKAMEVLSLWRTSGSTCACVSFAPLLLLGRPRNQCLLGIHAGVGGGCDDDSAIKGNLPHSALSLILLLLGPPPPPSQ